MMELVWETRRVSTSERTLDKIANELPAPVGIIVMGEDGYFKNRVIDRLTSSDLGELMMGYFNAGLNDFLEFNNGGAILLLDSAQSRDRSIRLMCVHKMHAAGAKTVVGVYAARSLMLEPPPDADEMDYLVAVSEETRGNSCPLLAADTRPL